MKFFKNNRNEIEMDKKKKELQEINAFCKRLQAIQLLAVCG